MLQLEWTSQVRAGAGDDSHAQASPGKAVDLPGGESGIHMTMGGCDNYGPFLGTPNIRCRTLIGIQKGTIISTITHIECFLLVVSAAIIAHQPFSDAGTVKIAGPYATAWLVGLP